MTTAKDALVSTLNNAYAVFARYQLQPEDVERLLDDAAARQRLTDTPLRALAAEDLEVLAAAPLPALSFESFKYLLPRLLELVAIEGQWWLGLETITGKLRAAEWQAWPGPERQALRKCFVALWRCLLSEFPSTMSADECLQGLAQVECDLRPYLDGWRRTKTVPALCHLANFVKKHSEELFSNGTLYGWQASQQQTQQVIGWLLEPRTSEVLEYAFYKHSSKRLAREFVIAVDNLAWVRKALESTAPGA